MFRAEPPGSINVFPRTFQIDLNVEAMFATAKAVALGGAESYFINTGAKIDASPLGDHVAAFPDRYFRLAFAVTVEPNADFPGSNARAFNDRVRGHIKVFNP